MNRNWREMLRHEWPHWVLLGGMWVAAVLSWSRVETPIPVHWNLHGKVDGYGGRFEGLLLLPLIGAGIYLLLLAVPRLDPARANYASFTGPYRAMRLSITVLMAAIYGVILLAAFGHPIDTGRWLFLAVGLMFVVLGNVLGKVRPNYFVGIRTPWTLASTRSWERTHRVGGRLFVGAGVALAIAGLIKQPAFTVAVLVAAGLGLLWLVYYSYAAWRSDPERIPVTGTRPAPEDR